MIGRLSEETAGAGAPGSGMRTCMVRLGPGANDNPPGRRHGDAGGTVAVPIRRIAGAPAAARPPAGVPPMATPALMAVAWAGAQDRVWRRHLEDAALADPLDAAHSFWRAVGESARLNSGFLTAAASAWLAIVVDAGRSGG